MIDRDREEAAARRALEAAETAVHNALIRFAASGASAAPDTMYSSAILAIRNLDPAQFRTDRKDGHD